MVIKRFTADLHIAGDNLSLTFYLNHTSHFKALTSTGAGRNFSISLKYSFCNIVANTYICITVA